MAAATVTQLTLDGTDARFRIVPIREGFTSDCFGAKCAACGKWLTKWDFTREDAASGAEHELDRVDGREHRCAQLIAPRAPLFAPS
jgi:hypothetical protein